MPFQYVLLDEFRYQARIMGKVSADVSPIGRGIRYVFRSAGMAAFPNVNPILMDLMGALIAFIQTYFFLFYAWH